MQVENMRRGRQTLRLFIRQLASSDKEKKNAGYVERALRDVHPRTEYSEEMLMRDLADACVTLDRLERGRRRSDREKLIECALLCECLKDEFLGNSVLNEAEEKD